LTRLRGRSPFGAAKARVSTHLRKKHFSKKMDCRVKPGNDAPRFVSQARCGILHAASQNRDPGFFFL
jgi:hypothetical protein